MFVTHVQLVWDDNHAKFRYHIYENATNRNIILPDLELPNDDTLEWLKQQFAEFDDIYDVKLNSIKSDLDDKL
jgi:hypothetical protein